MTQITSHQNKALVAPVKESPELQQQRQQYLAQLLAEFQAMTREMSAYEIGIWASALSCYPLSDIEQAMKDFIETASRDDARGVVLGDVIGRVNRLRDSRQQQLTAGRELRKIEEWRLQHEAEVAADPEGFDKARREAQERFRKMFGKSLEQVVAESPEPKA